MQSLPVQSLPVQSLPVQSLPCVAPSATKRPAGRSMAPLPARRGGPRSPFTGFQQVSLPQRAVLTLSLSVGRPTAPTTTSAGKT
jgi:hypothetical protein